MKDELKNPELKGVAGEIEAWWLATHRKRTGGLFPVEYPAREGGVYRFTIENGELKMDRIPGVQE